MAVWHWLLDAMMGLLAWLHNLIDPLPILGPHSWGWAIIGLTVIVRIALVPLAVKQFKSMRGMQELAPEMQRIKKKYKVDREVMKKDPEKYKAQRQKMNEETMALYKEHGVNPAAGCLPLLLQAPIFFAIFRILMDPERVIDGERIGEATFYVFSPLGELARAVTIWGWLLVVVMAASMFVAQKQMMAKNPATEGFQAQQQKIMLYGMPAFLGIFGMNLPIGVLLYWVTTNLWQMGQQAFILREVKEKAAEAADEAMKRPEKPAKGAGKPEILDKPRDSAARRGRSNGDRRASPEPNNGEKKKSKKPSESPDDADAAPPPKATRGDDHLPRRRRGNDH